MVNWHSFPESEADQPLPVEGGLHLHAVRGRLGQTWWAQRWLSPVEDNVPRPVLENGRRYARRGQLLSLDVQPGLITAMIQGSAPSPYRTTVAIAPFSAEVWAQVQAGLLARSFCYAALLAHDFPRAAEGLFAEAGVQFFPVAPTELTPACTCAEHTGWCTHAAALWFIFVDRLDENPFLMLQVRGRGEAELLGALRQSWGAPPQPVEVEPQIDLTVQDLPLSRFYRVGCDLDGIALPPPPSEPAKVMRRLGFPPFFPHGERAILQTLANLYEDPDDVID